MSQTIVIFYTEILTGKVVLWCFFSSETSEKIHNSTFYVKISVTSHFLLHLQKKTQLFEKTQHFIWPVIPLVIRPVILPVIYPVMHPVIHPVIHTVIWCFFNRFPKWICPFFSLVLPISTV